jgi:hypothetical protein
MSLQKIKTDADVAVMLRNVGLMISELAKKCGKPIYISAYDDGHVRVGFGDYTYWSTDDAYSYEPVGNKEDNYLHDMWRKVKTDQIVLDGVPRRWSREHEDLLRMAGLDPDNWVLAYEDDRHLTLDEPRHADGSSQRVLLDKETARVIKFPWLRAGKSRG